MGRTTSDRTGSGKPTDDTAPRTTGDSSSPRTSLSTRTAASLRSSLGLSGGHQRRVEQRREELMRHMLVEGFAELTVADMATALGCSKRTLYEIAPSKEQLATSSVRLFFRRATEQVEAELRRVRSPERRVERYLESVAAALEPASRTFLYDMTSFAPTRELYEQNTLAASIRVRELIDEGVAAGRFRSVPTAFIGEVVTATMRRIGSGEIARNTGLTDAESYSNLAKLVVAAVRR